MALIRVDNVSFSYPGCKTPALDRISFSLGEGEILGIIGLNGSGKTTLSYCLCGIIPHYLGGTLSGIVWLRGKDSRNIPLSHFLTDVGILFQDPNAQLVMPSVEEEIIFPLENLCLSRTVMEERLHDSLQLTGIPHLQKEDPNKLSGGEKQLVALAAALALDPPILILDEALSMLDSQATIRILEVLQRVNKRGTGLIIVDHTLRSARLWDNILVLEKGQIISRSSASLLTDATAFLKEHNIIFP